jgi:DNA polymerase II small subunit
MVSNEILRFCVQKGLLVDNDLLNLFSETDDIESVKLVIEKIKNHTQKRVITKNLFNENKDKVNDFLSGLSHESRENLKIKLGLSIEISKEVSVNYKIENKKDFNFNEIKILSMHPAGTKKLEVLDFVNYFRGRLKKMRGILMEHSELSNLVSINKISGNRQGVSIIGIVSNKSYTKNKNIILEIEDLTGKVKALVHANKPDLIEKAEEIPLDAVIGFKGSGNSDIFFVNDIIFPESMLQERKKGIDEEYIVFIGDMHVGSKLFLEKEFLKFIDYLNGKLPNTPEVEKIKNVFIVGDLISGVGIFPGQEKELTIPDVEGQYAKVAELLSKIRKDITLIISPGNHDALRIMEPQPLLDEKYAWPLYNLKNVILTGNPAYLNIGSKPGFSGYDILTYHGMSYHYYANNISRLMKEKAVHKPDKIMHYLLKFRHLAPSHSSVQYFPSEDDSLVIDKVPDIFLSGHTHKSAISYYNNILTISCSAWESMTPFQEKMGNQPDFCKVPIFNMKTRAVKVLDFEDYSTQNNKVKI